MSIRLPRLPERGAVKITFTAGPELRAALADYAEVYARTYGQKESIADYGAEEGALTWPPSEPSPPARTATPAPSAP